MNAAAVARAQQAPDEAGRIHGRVTNGTAGATLTGDVTVELITLLDGGMGRELKRMGAPFRQPEWSALALMEAPDFVSEAHAAFIAAGAEVVTTNSYAVVPFHIGEDRFAADGGMLAERAGRLARAAADIGADSGAGRKILVAASLPPLFGSYRPDLFDAARAPELLRTLVEGLAPHADLWLAETLGSIAEAAAASAFWTL